MIIEDTKIPGVKVLTSKVFKDSRGYFTETWTERGFNKLTETATDFVQDNQSLSVKGVIRGLHFQYPPFAQAKLVRCIHGRVMDVALDIRKGSPTFGEHLCIELSGDNFKQLFLPRGIAHGFAVLSESALFAYKCDNYYAPGNEGGINMFDSVLGISWPYSQQDALLSDKDLTYPLWADFDSPFVFEP